MKSDENGTYSWRHTVNLYRNPGVLWLLVKVFSGIFAGCMLFGLWLGDFKISLTGVKNATQMGVGATVATRNGMYSEFASVGTVKVDKTHNTVHIRNGLFHNQIFAGDEDFDFVVDFIVGHCPKARVRFKPPRDFTDDDFNNKPSSKAKKKRSTNHVF